MVLPVLPVASSACPQTLSRPSLLHICAPVSSPRMQASQVERLFSPSSPPSLFMPKPSANMKKEKGKKEGQKGQNYWPKC